MAVAWVGGLLQLYFIQGVQASRSQQTTKPNPTTPPKENNLCEFKPHLPYIQLDVVAIAWREKCILLGECKWGTKDVGRSVVRELVGEKTPRVLAALSDRGEGWTVHYAFFARTGFTEAARAEAARHNAILVNLVTLNRELGYSEQEV